MHPNKNYFMIYKDEAYKVIKNEILKLSSEKIKELFDISKEQVENGTTTSANSTLNDLYDNIRREVYNLYDSKGNDDYTNVSVERYIMEEIYKYTDVIYIH